MLKHMFIAIAVLLLGVLSCGKEKSANKPGLQGQQENSEHFNEGTGYLVFSPPPGTYYEKVKIVIRPRALATNKKITYSVLNADANDCSEEGDGARCIELKSSRKIEYVIKTTTDSLIAGKEIEEQIPGSVEYVVKAGNPPPRPDVPVTQVKFNNADFKLQSTYCTSSEAKNASVYLALGNDEVIGKLNTVWFKFMFTRDESQGPELKISESWAAVLSKIRGNADGRPTLAQYSSDSSALHPSSCVIRMKQHSQKADLSGLHGDIECSLRKYTSDTFPPEEVSVIKVTDWYCP